MFEQLLVIALFSPVIVGLAWVHQLRQDEIRQRDYRALGGRIRERIRTAEFVQIGHRAA